MPVPKALQQTAFVCLLALGLAGYLQPAHAQNDTQERPSLFGLQSQGNPLQRLRQGVTPEGGALALEGAVDPAAYLVGPGDLFSISIGGPEPTMVTLPVSADGFLMLPSAGSIAVAGQTLEAVRARALAALRPQFQHIGLAVSLAQPRRFYVHVAGAVPTPGRYLATPVARVASVLEQAYADTTQATSLGSAYRPSLRNVTLIRRDGSRQSLDLLRYFTTGSIEANPYLQDGDVISVPSFDPNYEALFVSGAVASPGTYAYRPGDTARDLLALATGRATPDDARQIRLTRTLADGTTDVRMIDLQAAGRVPLQPLDHLYVLPDAVARGTATVGGWVQYPGTYPIEPGRTTLRELIDRAGGLRPRALARAAYLERTVLPEAPAGTAADGTGAARLAALRPDTTAILRQMRLADFGLQSRTYFAQELRLQHRVSLDLAALLTPEADPVYVQDGDRLFIPRDEQTVFVFGQVNRPGYVSHLDGRTADYYVAAAGGRSLTAATAYVIKTGTNRYLPADEAVIESGDMIFLDRRGDVIDSADLKRLLLQEEQLAMEDERIALDRRRIRSDNRFRTVQTVAQVAATVASVVTTYLFLRSQE